MSTRSFIGIENGEGIVEAIYCHWDGYLEHNGVLLHNHYNSRGKVSLLICQGSLSCLEKNIKDCDFYNKQHEDLQRYTFPDRDTFLEKVFPRVEAVYLFSNEDKWIYWHRVRYPAQELSVVLSRANK